jgi:lambda family phage portal protein
MALPRRLVLRGKRSLIGSLLSSTWVKLGSWLGAYDATDPRNVGMRGLLYRDANPVELAASVPQMRALARQVVRNNPVAKAIVEGITANLVGSGIGLEPQTGDPSLDDLIRPVWSRFITRCGIGGESVYALQHLAGRELPTCGEALWRFQPMPADPSRQIPLAVIALEPECLDEGFAVVGQEPGGATVVAGVEFGAWGTPVGYWIQSGGQRVRVPAEQIAHVFDRNRPGQIRGETWFAPILTTLRQERDLVVAELQASKNTAAMSLVITSQAREGLGVDEAGEPVTDIPAGSLARLLPGEACTPISHTRPAQGIAPFRAMLRGDIAGAMRIGQRWIDRDVSRANYSSLRADMLDEDRIMSPLREQFGHATIGKLYLAALPYIAILIGRPIRDAGYRLIPDGQPYVDPQKDAAAALAAIGGNLSTYEAEIGKRGGDAKQVFEQRRRERMDAAADEIAIVEVIQAEINEANARTPGLNLQWAQVVTIGGASSAPGAYLTAATTSQTVQSSEGEPADTEESPENPQDPANVPDPSVKAH